MVPLYTVKIRRDAHTVTPVTLPEYEITVMQVVAGKENVQTADGRSIDEYGLGEPAGFFKTSEDEYTRLCNKYGAEVIEGIYGKKVMGALDKVVDDARVDIPGAVEIAPVDDEKAAMAAKIAELEAKLEAANKPADLPPTEKQALLAEAKALGLNPAHNISVENLKKAIDSAKSSKE